MGCAQHPNSPVRSSREPCAACQQKRWWDALPEERKEEQRRRDRRNAPRPEGRFRRRREPTPDDQLGPHTAVTLAAVEEAARRDGYVDEQEMRAAVLVMVAAIVGPDRAATATGYSPIVTAPMMRRLRAGGAFHRNRVSADVIDPNNGGVALALAVALALGYVEARRVPSPAQQRRAAKAAETRAIWAARDARPRAVAAPPGAPPEAPHAR